MIKRNKNKLSILLLAISALTLAMFFSCDPVMQLEQQDDSSVTPVMACL